MDLFFYFISTSFYNARKNFFKYIKLMISNTKISFPRKDKRSDLPDCDLIYLNDAKCIFQYDDEEILGFEDTTYLIGESEIIIKDPP